MTSIVVWNCIKKLRTVAVWVPGHRMIKDNEKADELTKREQGDTSEPEINFGVPKSAVNERLSSEKTQQ